VPTFFDSIFSARGKKVEEEYDEDDNACSLQVSGSLTLRHPGGLLVLQFAGDALPWRCIVSSSFLVRVVSYVSRGQRDRRSSHEVTTGIIVQVMRRPAMDWQKEWRRMYGRREDVC